MKVVTILSISLLLFSCVVYEYDNEPTYDIKTYNTPFVDADETIRLEFEMTKDNVIEIFKSPPLFVESGDSKTVVWVYEVRTIEVKSKYENGDVVPSKTSQDTQHVAPIHKLALVFDADGKLLSWGPYEK
jgi:outer membrane protein assembly factor BamE (lipoprotein component of BamABCDE complex)